MLNATECKIAYREIQNTNEYNSVIKYTIDFPTNFNSTIIGLRSLQNTFNQ